MLGLEGDEMAWDEPRAHGLHAVFAELQGGDAYLYRPSEGGLHHVSHALHIEATMGGSVLVETHHEHGGVTAQRFTLIVEPMRSDEPWHAALARALSRQLQIEPNCERRARREALREARREARTGV